MKKYILSCEPNTITRTIVINKPDNCRNQEWGSDYDSLHIRTKNAEKIKPFEIETTIEGIKVLREFSKKSWTV